jgi:hypothetical protein
MFRVLMPDGQLIVLQDLAQFVSILDNLTVSQGGVKLHARDDAEGVLITIDPGVPGPTVPATSAGPGQGKL